MANEIRVRSNGRFGTITDNPLSAGATSIGSTELAGLPAIGATEHLALVLDPDGLAGPAEIVWITAHGVSSTSATIDRGKEGTTDRVHAIGTPWLHGPTRRDFRQLVYAERPVAAGNLAITAGVFAPVDPTNLDYVSMLCEPGDVVECTLTAVIDGPANLTDEARFDVQVDQPLSADSSIGAATDGVTVEAGPGTRTVHAVGWYLVLERGVHGFRPTARITGSSITIRGTASYPPARFTVRNAGPQTDYS